MQLGQLLARGREAAEIGGERDAGQFALEVVGELLPVAGVVQQAVDVVEDVPLRDLLVAVGPAEFPQPPAGNVLPPVAAVFVVDVEGEALRWVGVEIKVGDKIGYRNRELFTSVPANNKDLVIAFLRAGR